MEFKLVHMWMKIEKNININNNSIPELSKISAGNKINNLYFKNNKKDLSNQMFEIICGKQSIQKNIGKIIYKKVENIKDTK